MRILLVHNYYQQRGGEDGVFEQEVRMLREHGHTVDTLEFTNEGFDGSLMGNLIGAAKSIYNWESARRTEQAIDAFRPDVVHIHNLFYAASPSVIRAAKRRGIPVVMTLHNYRLVCNSGMLSREAEVPCERCLTKTIPLDGIQFGCFRDSRLQSAQLTVITSLHKLTGIWQSVDRFIVLTEFARKKMLESSLNLKPEQVLVKPNSVPELGYSGPENRESFFLYVGRLSFEKGIKVLLDAARLGTFPIEIVGDGPLRPLVEQTAAELPHVRYVGKLPREQAMERMKRCRAVIVPSVCYEGLPTTILEAYATGTPVICSDQENMLGVIEQGKFGSPFASGDAQSLHQAIGQARHQPIVSIYAESLYGQYVKEYSSHGVLKQIISIYDELQVSRPSRVHVSVD